MFLSPCFNHEIRDRCAQYISCFINRSSNSLLEVKKSALLSYVISPLLMSSTRVWSAFILLASGCALDEPHACRSAPYEAILSFILFKPELSPTGLVYASLAIASNSSHSSHDSSNLKLRGSLALILLEVLICKSKGTWSDACENRWVTMLAGILAFQLSVATARSSRCLVLADPGCLLFQVNG